MTSLPATGYEALVDDVAATQTAAMIAAAEGALVKALRAELLDHEIENLLAVVTAELIATYLAVADSPETITGLAGCHIQASQQRTHEGERND